MGFRRLDAVPRRPGAIDRLVEHHAEWFDRVNRLLQSRGITNVEFHLIGPDDAPASQERIGPRDVDYRSQSRGYKNAQFVSYARSIDDYPDGTFDLVLVDGRARMACLAHAIPKVSPGRRVAAG